MPPPADVLRLLDASLNRASEGARVVEDYVRFVLGDSHLSRLAKELRHGVTGAASTLPRADRLACRDTPGDVGTHITALQESRREDAWQVCQASLGRTQEALRSLEEYGKIVSPELGASFESLRYRCYTLAKAIGATTVSLDRLADRRLYALIDCQPDEEAFARLATSLCEAGVDLLQLRDKSASDRTLLERACLLASICRQQGALSIVNDRADIAHAAGVDGVHVGQEELPAAEARRTLGPRGLVGVSTHSIEQARAAVVDGADYLGVGPTFPSQTKSFDEFPGLEFIRQVAAEIRLPAFAIGGITRENLAQVLAAGANRIAVSSAITGGSDPSSMAKSLKQMLRTTLGNRTESQ